MVIAVENLQYRYPGAAAPVLAGLNFAVAEGEVYGLLGPSGAGKSTTQRILMGMLRGFSGRAELFGQPVETLGRGLYERIGVSFELPALYLRLTALENLRLFAALYDKPTREPREVLAEVDLGDAAEQRVEQFSKGMKMRLNLARALLHDPDLLFLDEPTTGQDPARARVTRDLIRRLRAAGKTIFLTTHNMAEAEEICDRVGFLVRGSIPVTGTPEELKRRYGQRLLEARVGTGPESRLMTFPMEGIGGNASFLELLASGQVTSLHTLEASLDEVFIRATGDPEAAA
ncbi:MAG TPA: ABC transporter ATP-binding protein [Devosiaceae bacterium]|jgi:fluoroquinolone transport system ATP-binding protein|nr:ABC transporter ATP-binding protein [Devosiaceae bacterium]